MTHAEETEGKPSASAVERYIACAGSYQAERDIPPEELLESAYAASGDRVHAALEKGDVSDLGASEAEVSSMISEKQQEIFEKWKEDYDVTDAKVFKEERIWLTHLGEKVFSAKLDAYAISEERKCALVMDAKSGRKAVTPPVRNWQLRSGLAALAVKYGLHYGRVTIVQPFAKKQQPCDYKHIDLFGGNGALSQLLILLQNINKPNPPRRAGPHCDFCAARHICPKSTAVVTEIAELSGRGWSAMKPEDKIALWEKSKLAVKIAEHIQNNVRAELDRNPFSIPGLEVTPDQNVRVVRNVIKAFSKMLDLSTSPGTQADHEEVVAEVQRKFNDLVKMSIGGLEGWYREKFGGTKDEVSEKVTEIFRECITLDQKRGSIKQTEVKPKELA